MAITNLLGYGINHERVLNGFFDDWFVNVPDDWIVPYGTTTKESVIVKVGSYSCKLDPAATLNGTIYQDAPNVDEWIGRVATYYCWVWSDQPDYARIGISDGVSTVWSARHPGDSTWRRYEVSVFVPGGATTTRAIMEVSYLVVGGNAYFDNATLPLYVPGDTNATADVTADMVWEVDSNVYRAGMREVRDMIIDCTIDIDTGVVKDIDLMTLVPVKYHTSVILDQYLDEVSILIGQWLRYIQDMEELLNPDTVPDEYIQKLSALIGLIIAVDEETTIADKRSQLRQAIDWYKIKGTYESILLVAYMSGLTTVVHDYYTNDYVTFVKVVEFFGANYPGENPPGFDSSYYKSPHFGIEVLLDRVYNLGTSDEFLFREEKITKMIGLVEQTRPVNTVPHYITLLVPLCYEDGIVYQTSGNLVYATVTDAWTYQKKYFDEGIAIPVVDNLGQQVYDNAGNRVVVQGESWKFDDGVFFDQNYDAFLNAINKFKLGNGSKGVIPDRSTFTLQSITYTGDVSEINIYPDRTEYNIVVPASVVRDDFSELGLFLSDNATMTVALTFDELDKIEGVELRIQVVIYKTRP